MFGKIKDRLRSVFDKSEEVVEEDQKEREEDQTPQQETSSGAKEQEAVSQQETTKQIAEEPLEEELSQQLESGTSELVEPTPEEEQYFEEGQKPHESEEQQDGLFKKTFGRLTSKTISEDDFDKIWVELQVFLLEINIAYDIVERIEQQLREQVVNQRFDRFSLSRRIREVMTKEVEDVLAKREEDFEQQLKEALDKEKPLPILVLGVNGTGKTTTIAKFVKWLRDHGYSSVVAASDTFRAAAGEQLEEHAKALDFRLIQQKKSADPAAVAYDAVEHAKAKGVDVVLIDTAGRMPNNANLMMELQKVQRVSKSRMTLFVGDSVAGNDLLEQIELFDKGLGIDGLILTKVDTDERPGSVVTAAYSLEKPIYFLGTGQRYDDFMKYDAHHIADRLFSLEEDS